MANILITGRSKDVEAGRIEHDLNQLSWLEKATRLVTTSANRFLEREVRVLAERHGLKFYSEPVDFQRDGNGAMYTAYERLSKKCHAALVYIGDRDEAGIALCEQRGRDGMAIARFQPTPTPQVPSIDDLPDDRELSDDTDMGFPDNGGGPATGDFDGEQQATAKTVKSPTTKVGNIGWE